MAISRLPYGHTILLTRLALCSLTEHVKVATERISACPGHIGDDRTSECKLRHRLTI